MLQAELDENLFWACLKYAYDNGGITNWLTFFPEQFQLSGSDIYRWTHSSTQPTNADLLEYDLTDLDEVKDLWEEAQQATKGQTFVTSTAHATILTPYCVEGQFYYDTTTSSLKILIGNSWVSI